MKNFIAALAIGLLAVPAAAATTQLAGVSDEETTIPSGGVKQYQFGKGDVVFVSDRTDQWYRVELNDGCLRNPMARDSVVFGRDDATGIIDRFSMVRFVRDGRLCQIDSIRKSVAPPQIDSKSPVTLD